MIQDVLQSIDGIAAYPVVAMVLFFGAFIMMVVRVMRMKREDLDILSRMPLGGDDPSLPEGDTTRG